MIIMLIAFIFSVVILILVAAVRPDRPVESKFELSRLDSLGDKYASKSLKRENLIVYVISIKAILVALLLVIATLLSVSTFGWVTGVIVAAIVSMEYGYFSRLNFSRKLSTKLYERFEEKILSFIDKNKTYLRFFRSVNFSDFNHEQVISSREELSKLVNESLSVLTPQEKLLIVNGLQFSDKTVKSVMTPRGVIASIKKGEFLGPVTLNDLHKLGHSRLPVINGDIDHVVGVLHIKDLLNLDEKKSMAAEKAMEDKVYYINEEQNLDQALAAFIKTHHHLFIVINEYRETVGLLTLEDVIEELLGRKIVDEFDMHTDLRAVAKRNLDKNNSPKHSVDV